MPGLARKVIICAAVDGLVLHPLNSKKESRSSAAALAPVRIKYGDASISPVPRGDAAYDLLALQREPNSSFEAYGIVGM